MKDDRLEKEFGEYFKGVKTPENITGGAKNYVAKKRTKLPRFVKFASVAAGFVLVFVVLFAFLLRPDAEYSSPANGNDSAEAPDGQAPDFSDKGNDKSEDEPGGTPSDPSFDDESVLRTYASAELIGENADVFTLSSKNGALKVIENFAYATNAQVTLCTANYLNGDLANVRAEVSLVSEARHETEIVVEFTEDDLVYEPLADYLFGEIRTYNGAEYYLTREIAENGEPLFKLFLRYDGVKYYFRVQSSDEQCYMYYLKMIAG